MKKILLLLLTIFTISAATAQGNNLKFNRALYEDYSINLTSGYDYKTLSNAFTVPTDKVWKVTSLTGSITSTNQYLAPDVGISKNGVGSFSVNVNSYSQKTLWLPSGSYDIRCHSTSQSGNYKVLLSGVEFNLVQ
jgi:hypothetical protein